MARKAGNSSIFQIDKTSFFWTMKCGSCHPGSGGGEYDRDGKRYWEATDGFGYQNLTVPKTQQEVYDAKDGDYTFLHPQTLKFMPAPWQTTGVSEADCLMCHMDSYSWFNRAVTFGAGPNLLSDTGTYLAFQAGPTAGAGWASFNMAAVRMVPGQLPFLDPTLAPTNFLVDYSLGVTAGTLVDNGMLTIPADKIVGATPDDNCRNCHATPDVRKMGRSWADNTDVHKAGGLTCVSCHPAGSNATDPRINTKFQHDFAKGNSSVESVSDALDGTMADCEGCHVNGTGSVTAPDPTVRHNEVFKDVNGNGVFSLHFAKISCEACHIPYKEDSVGTPPDPDLFIDMATTGSQVVYPWSTYFGIDGVNPDPSEANPTGLWYPSLVMHRGKIFVAKPLVTMWWGEWNGQMNGNEVVEPYPLWQVRQAISTSGVTASDDNSDGTPEVNTELEIATYIDALKNTTLQVTDKDDQPVSQAGVFSNPVLVTGGGRIFYVSDTKGNSDPSDDIVASFESSTIAERENFSVHHNVQPKSAALGAVGCTDCHATDKPFFNRKALVDPWEFTADNFGGGAHYENAWETLGYTQTEVDTLTASVPAVSTTTIGGGGGGGCAILETGGTMAGGAGALIPLLIGLLWISFARERRG